MIEGFNGVSWENHMISYVYIHIYIYHPKMANFDGFGNCNHLPSMFSLKNP